MVWLVKHKDLVARRTALVSALLASFLESREKAPKIFQFRFSQPYMYVVQKLPRSTFLYTKS